MSQETVTISAMHASRERECFTRSFNGMHFASYSFILTFNKREKGKKNKISNSWKGRQNKSRFDLGRFDLGRFDLGRFDLGRFDLGRFD